MPNDEPTPDVLLAALERDPALRRAVAEWLVDRTLHRKVGELLDGGAVVEILSAALTEDNARRVTERWLEPSWDRIKARSEAEGDTVGDAVPEPHRETVRELVREARLPSLRWAEGAVDPKLVRDLLSPVLQQTLIGFVKKLPMFGGAADRARGLGNLAGAFGKRALEGAGKLADVGRGVLGGIDDRVQQVAGEFSQGALGGIREALRERLRSDEGRRLVGQIREQILDRLLETEVHALMKDGEVLPPARIRDVAAALVSHNATRQYVERAVREEVEAWLALEGERPLVDVLEEAALLEPVRVEAVRILSGE